MVAAAQRCVLRPWPDRIARPVGILAVRNEDMYEGTIMTQLQWTAVDDYFGETLIGPDDALDRALANSNAAGLPDIQVTANQGKLLFLLAQIQGANRILEIGTLGGYSTIWLARALPAGGC